MSYSIVAVIFNPNSTRPSENLAKAFSKRLQARLPKQRVELIATQYSGHGEHIAYDLAKKYKKPLVISSSGDGGYNDVINGLMKAQKENSRSVAGLLPAGNANDHHRRLTRGNLVESIASHKPEKIDLLRIDGKSNGKSMHRYGHSYIGFGLTPHIGQELNKTKLNVFTQAWAVLKGLFNVRPVELIVHGKQKSYDSIVMSNIDTMSKVLKISTPSPMDDGKFEVTVFTKRHKLKLIVLLIRTSVIGAKEDMRTKRFRLKTVKETLVQVDGEIFTLDAHSRAAVTIKKRTLNCIV